jgi:hypothetical protein
MRRFLPRARIVRARLKRVRQEEIGRRKKDKDIKWTRVILSPDSTKKASLVPLTRRRGSEKRSEISSDAAGSSAGDSGEIGGARRSLELKVMSKESLPY